MAAAEMPMVGAPSAGGDLGSAPAPGPGMGMPPADVLFTLTAAGANCLLRSWCSPAWLTPRCSRPLPARPACTPLVSTLTFAPVCVISCLQPSSVIPWLRKSVLFFSWPACSHQIVWCSHAGAMEARKLSLKLQFSKQLLTCPALRAAAFTNTTSGSEFVSRNGRWLSDPVVAARNSSSALLQLANPVYDAAAKTVTFQVGVLSSGLKLSAVLLLGHTHACMYVECAFAR